MLSSTPPYPTIRIMNGTCAAPMLSNSMTHLPYPTLPYPTNHARNGTCGAPMPAPYIILTCWACCGSHSKAEDDLMSCI